MTSAPHGAHTDNIDGWILIKPQATAVRTRKGTKTVVRVTLPDGKTVELGGKRAERAQAVILVHTPEGYHYHPNTWGVYGLRGDAIVAQREAAAYVAKSAKSTDLNGYSFCDKALSIPVTG